MLNYSLETEIKASEVYAELLPMIEQTDDLYDSIEQIYLSELKSVEEMRLLVGKTSRDISLLSGHPRGA